MKKIFTLIAATLFTVALFAADRRPVVSVKASRNYEIVIDGQSYFGGNNTMNISNIRNGKHSIRVYEVSRSFMFRRGKRLVDATSFQLRNNDVDIYVDYRGQINITEDRFDHDRRNDHRDYDRDNSYGRDQQDSRDQDSRDNNNGYDKKDGRDQNSRDQNHGNDKNNKDKRF